jgi:uncharacterized repeat protein (TIGR03803 family)
MWGKAIFKKQQFALLFIIASAVTAATAQTETVLYSFCPQTSCVDGSDPNGTLIFDKNGDIVGTTTTGGANANGTVFKLTSSGKESVLYSFCSQTNCTDGAQPYAEQVLFDAKGNMYGTTMSRGINGGGTVFKLAANGKEKTVYNFCATGCTSGEGPHPGLIADRKGNLYGTTAAGGSHNSGTVFKLTPGGKETVLYNFCMQTNCPDGSTPYAGLIMDAKGNFYGTTTLGGTNRQGVVFKLTPKGKETVLYNFCGQSQCVDGAQPWAEVIRDKNGNLYGTTIYGGRNGNCPGNEGCGVVFKLTPKGKETVLYTFCPQTGCDDGGAPVAGLIVDGQGNFYGTTYYGGGHGCFYGCGTVFELSPMGIETVLHSFCSENNCADGAEPYSGLVADGSGNLYGTTRGGGGNNNCNGAGCGVVYEISPGAIRP